MVLFFFLLFGLVASASGFSCKDQDGNNVDWFAVYKMPIESDNSVPGIGGGIGFYYVDVKKAGALKPSTETLDSKKQAIAYTLQQYYAVQTDNTIFHVMYNDEPWTASSTSEYSDNESFFSKTMKYMGISDSVQKGHTKGVIFFNKSGGVWLVHSVPQFPPPTAYAYPTSGHDYGQTMLCMTFKYSELKKIGTQLYYNYPDIYSSKLPSDMASENPDLAKAIGGQRHTGSPAYSVVDLTTDGGYTFKSFAKTNEFNKDLYDDLIATNLKVNLLAETWRRGDAIPLACKASYHTLDALDIKVGTSAKFSYTKDHSKMARSRDSTKPYVCIGDINRMTSQYVRGGGSECIMSTFLWNSFNVILDSNACPNQDFLAHLRTNRVQ